MQLFTYKAKDIGGHTLKGDVEAVSISVAAEMLRKKKLVIISLKPGKVSAIKQLSTVFNRVKMEDVVMFTRQLSAMIAAGLPLTDALRILQNQSSPGMSEVIGGILADVEGGSTLGDALEKRKKVFSHVYISLVRAGESAGVLDDILNRLANNLEKQKEFKGKVSGALIYPVIVVIGMMIVAFIMMVFVIPKLTAMYDNFGAELPIMTKILISVSKIMASFWYLIIAAVIGVIALFKGWLKTVAGREKFETIVFRLPIIGKLNKYVILTEFTRTLGLLVGAGIAILDGLKITAEAVGNSIYRKGLLDAAEQVEKGMPLAVPISQNPYFPPILGQMINVGEETGKLDEILLKISHYFETESEQGVAGLTAAVEPLIMIVLGIGVGILVIAIIMPIYNLTSSISG